MITKEKALELAREAKFVVNLDPSNKWHIIIGNERDLERLVNAIYNTMSVANANDMKFTTAKEYMETSMSELEILLERALKITTGQYLTKKEEEMALSLLYRKRTE